MKLSTAPLHCPCDRAYFETVFTYDAPPEGEIRFGFSSKGSYRREVLRCGLCGHFISIHDMDTGSLYTGDYVSSTYADDDGVRRSFERVMALEPGQSDNVGRIRRVLAFAGRELECAEGPPTVLDVGSGLCVFLHGMKAAGWDCTALDPDARSARHAREVVGVRAVCGDFMDGHDFGRFDLVTFNKVLEHVPDPVAMLTAAADHLKPGGFVYLEVPDGEGAIRDGWGREEFFIDHPHIFSAASVALMAQQAGFSICETERLREPSDKYTLRSFLALARGGTLGEDEG